ncbi:hypothetical protein Bsph_p058 (plasmid) [Lysinibacillus sphaericus C3-41]|uniref:Uncharacterized protein n=1 Tax=Lysinibacillus sphaericus (strain C3-41) TaxID=444177 RepID=B1I0C9_LYSSC|nr:hypothetical protein Bsph_p058 [Lysinibacillus sphaericus C3-41]
MQYLGGGEVEENLKKMKEKAYFYKGFGFHYLSAITNEDETVKGGSLFLIGKQMITLAVSNGYWTDHNGNPYKFKYRGRALYVGKIAVGFGNSDI